MPSEQEPALLSTFGYAATTDLAALSATASPNPRRCRCWPPTVLVADDEVILAYRIRLTKAPE